MHTFVQFVEYLPFRCRRKRKAKSWMHDAVISRMLPFAKREDKTQVPWTCVNGMRCASKSRQQANLCLLRTNRTLVNLTLEVSYLPASGHWLMCSNTAGTMVPVRILRFEEW
jgi:hypothetical protein